MRWTCKAYAPLANQQFRMASAIVPLQQQCRDPRLTGEMEGEDSIDAVPTNKMIMLRQS